MELQKFINTNINDYIEQFKNNNIIVKKNKNLILLKYKFNQKLNEEWMKYCKGCIIDTNINKTLADGLAAPFAGNLTFEFVKKYVDEIINVSENEMIESMRVIIERLKVIPEAAASACFVPILKNKLNIKKNANSIIVLCGGNIDLDKLKKLF